jgi:sulfopyruvate decarboxylase TPP-binding subunit
MTIPMTAITIANKMVTTTVAIMLRVTRELSTGGVVAGIFCTSWGKSILISLQKSALLQQTIMNVSLFVFKHPPRPPKLSLSSQ